MTRTINEKAGIIGDEIKQQISIAGEAAKSHVLDSFKNALENDIGALKSIVEKTVTDHSQGIADQIHASLNTVINQQLGGSIFCGILQNLVLPAVFQGITTGKVDLGSQNFREAAGQTLMDIGNAIARSGQRNG